MRITDLMMGDDVPNKREYMNMSCRVIKYKSIFRKSKRRVYECQKGICHMCLEHFEYEPIQGYHIIPWYKGGKR